MNLNKEKLVLIFIIFCKFEESLAQGLPQGFALKIEIDQETFF